MSGVRHTSENALYNACNILEGKLRRKRLKRENIQVTLQLHELEQIVSRLRHQYESSKGTCPLHRYTLMKDMVKETIEACREDNLGAATDMGTTLNLLRIKEEARRCLKPLHKDEIEASTEKKRRQIKKIRDLERQYQASKGLCFVRRYRSLKMMIYRTVNHADVRIDYTTDDEHHPLLASGQLGRVRTMSTTHY